MTNLKSIKRALLSSVIALLVCFSMLVGTTFAWFTDSVTSSGNIIQTGTLNVGMYWAEGDVDPASVTWTDASEGAIFNNDKWEPGYVEAKHLKVTNEGTLALKFKLVIVPNGEVSELADVIDVYYLDSATQVTREALATATPVGTLRDMIEDPDGAAYGYLLAEDESTEEIESVKTVTIAFKMRETTGNEYQNKSIGTDFSIQLLATQYTYEEDGLDNQYDYDATYTAEVDALKAKLEAAQPGDTVEYSLTHDAYVTSGITVPQGVNLVLDGNGHTVIMNLGGAGFYAYRAGLTVKNMNIIGSAQCAIFTKGDRGIVDGQMVEYLVYPVLENVTVNMSKSDISPLYFNGMGEATLTNCTIKGAGYVRTNYVNGAHIFAGAEMKVTVDGGNIGVVFINANGESTTSVFGSGITVNSGVVEKIVLESDWREDQANNAAYTYVGGTVKQVVKVVDTGLELENVLKEEGYDVALSRNVTLEGHLSSSWAGDINIDGSGNTLSIRGIYGVNGANVTLNNMTLVDNNPDDYMIYNQGGKIELNKVTYSGNTNKAFQLAGGGDVILTDCNIIGDVTGTYSASNIWCGDGRNVTVNGGTYGSIFMNVSEGANILSASKITVNGGTIAKLTLETEKNAETGDGNSYKSAVLVHNGGTITNLVENPQNYDLTGLTKLN